MIPEFVQLMQKSIDIHRKKNADYAAVDKAFENFERNAELSSWFAKDIDKAFVGLIATKLARLATLLNRDEDPNNESIEDSFLDLVTYCGLWASYNQRYPKKSSPSVKEVLTVSTTHPSCFNSVTRQHFAKHHFLKDVCQQCGYKIDNAMLVND